MQRRLLLVGTVVLLALAAGCTGGDGGGGGSGDADWCGTGSIQGVASQQAGGEFSVDVRGTTERDGREVCHVAHEFEGGSAEYARMDAFFDEGQEYFELIYYDVEGNVIYEIDVADGG